MIIIILMCLFLNLFLKVTRSNPTMSQTFLPLVASKPPKIDGVAFWQLIQFRARNLSSKNFS